MKGTRINFPSDELSLEGILALPKGMGPFPAVIVCHPHPLYGGSMDNNVVYSLCESLTQESFVSFKFNFRGVGGSQGESGQGKGERVDVESAISFISTVKEVDSKRVGLVGYSAGAGFAFPIGYNDTRIKALAAVSPPFTMFDFYFLKDCFKPKLLISGSRDNFIPIDQFFVSAQNLPAPKKFESIESADHFWYGYESAIAVKIVSFFTKVL